MNESVSFGSTIVGVVLGLAVLIFGEATHGNEMLVYVGGIIVLLSVGWLTGMIHALD